LQRLATVIQLLCLLLIWPGAAWGADATSFNPTTVSITAKSVGGGVPVGGIIIWAKSTNPTEGVWLDCNGQAFSAATYPELYAALGTTVVPNYAGMFLRGYGGQYSYHYNTVYHSSDGLGVVQGDAIRNIVGSFVTDMDFQKSSGAFYAGGSDTVDYGGSGNDGEIDMIFDASSVVPTALENRPVNVAVRYLIRAKS
jgi:hypothetical protein